MGSLILGEDGRSQGEDAAGIGDEKSEGGGGGFEAVVAVNANEGIRGGDQG